PVRLRAALVTTAGVGEPPGASGSSGMVMILLVSTSSASAPGVEKTPPGKTAVVCFVGGRVASDRCRADEKRCGENPAGFSVG
ncbi:MAG TPA: hypothetical protein P5040_01435, partial [Smithella sp.]|nr:hypothetical protein [Smithella sp.]